MTRDIHDFFVVQMQQNNNKNVISTFEIVIFCFECFEKKNAGKPMVHYSCILIDIRHLIHFRWLTIV
jgi:hypothetical protein